MLVQDPVVPETGATVSTGSSMSEQGSLIRGVSLAVRLSEQSQGPVPSPADRSAQGTSSALPVPLDVQASQWASPVTLVRLRATRARVVARPKVVATSHSRCEAARRGATAPRDAGHSPAVAANRGTAHHATSREAFLACRARHDALPPGEVGVPRADSRRDDAPRVRNDHGRPLGGDHRDGAPSSCVPPGPLD